MLYDFQQVALHIFTRYFDVVRTIFQCVQIQFYCLITCFQYRSLYHLTCNAINFDRDILVTHGIQIQVNNIICWIRIQTRLNWKAIALKKSRPKGGTFYSNRCGLLYFFNESTTALNASGWFIAKSAKTLRFNSIPLLFTAPMN